MSLDQNIRYTNPDPSDTLNPNGLYESFIVPQNLAGVGAPGSLTAVLGSTYTDTSTGQEYMMERDGTWHTFINYSSFAPAIPDPLTRNQINVTTIEPDTANSNNIQVLLPNTSNFVNVGVSGHLTNLQLVGDGSVVSQSATAAHIVSDGTHQVTYGPTSIVSSATPLTITGDTGVSIGTNSGDTQLDSANNVILNPSNIVLCNQGIYMAGGQMYTSQSDGTSGVLVAVDSVILKCSNNSVVSATSTNVNVTTSGDQTFTVGGNPTLAVQAGDLAITGDILPTSGSSYNLGRAANIWSEMHSVATFVQNGTAAAPSYIFETDHASGVYYAGGGEVGVSCSGTARAVVGPNNTVLSNNCIPSATNTYNLGSAIAAWQNIYSNNVLNVVSDFRKKENINDLIPGLDVINSLRPVSYHLREGNDRSRKIGFIAQEAKPYVEGYDVVNYDESNDLYSMKYDALIGVLVKSVQELSARVKELESSH
jgi:hypothetical protein